ncbi:MAG: sugar ABC transporter ATP-binding protein [Actinobacteria bacterium HGW-Actinobacteria-4]|nr:MAG: sugar ABC transporter ATP-binding protein [Actinobacteria bacterium HGW-Actinobacteria-4]
MVKSDLAPRGSGAKHDLALEVREVSKHFGGVTALDNVSFSLAPGEVRALIGENGAGKSTLIKVMTGVYRPDAGELRYLGERVELHTPRDAQDAGISTIYQEINLAPQMSAARNLYLGREPRTRLGLVDVRRMVSDAREVLSQFGVYVDPRTSLRELGMGVQQMVAVARAVTTDARVVIMDEPTSSLEPREVDRLFAVIRALRDSGVGVVYVSHKLDEVFAICDSITVLRDGKRVHDGPAAELDRLGLVGHMLGRSPEELRSAAPSRRTPVPHDSEVPALLNVQGLHRRHVLHDVSLQVRSGEVVGLAGLLGSRRSETVKAIFGALPVETGSVHIDGVELAPVTPARALAAGLALLPEDRKLEGIIPDQSIKENIVLAALPRLSRAGVVSDARRDELVEVFMRRLRIKAASPNQKVRELSGGNQQKVLLARLLCLQPRVLLLDEPTRGIDVGAKEEVRALIDELADAGLGVVLISSELEELADGADHVVVLQDGRVAGELSAGHISEGEIMTIIAHHDDQQSQVGS